MKIAAENDVDNVTPAKAWRNEHRGTVHACQLHSRT